jgi:predicted GNAT family N-acyltransferase
MLAINMKTVTLDDILSLRAKVLRPGRALNEAIFEGDDKSDTIHVALFEGDEIVACASLYNKNGAFFDDKRQYQLRGMAVEERCRGKGYGRALLKYSEFLMLNRGIDVLWLNARLDAVGFYKKQGYETYGEKFYIPDVCEHIVMAKMLSDATCEGCKK